MLRDTLFKAGQHTSTASAGMEVLPIRGNTPDLHGYVLFRYFFVTLHAQ